MNQDQLLGAVRWLVSVMCGYFVGRKWISADQVPAITAAVISLAPLAWSIVVKTDKAKVAAAQTVPNAQVVVSDSKLASPGVQIANPAEGEHVQVKVPKS